MTEEALEVLVRPLGTETIRLGGIFLLLTGAVTGPLVSHRALI